MKERKKKEKAKSQTKKTNNCCSFHLYMVHQILPSSWIPPKVLWEHQSFKSFSDPPVATWSKVWSFQRAINLTKRLLNHQAQSPAAREERGHKDWEGIFLINLPTPDWEDQKELLSAPSLTTQPQMRKSGTQKSSIFPKFSVLEELQPFVLKNFPFMFSEVPCRHQRKTLNFPGKPRANFRGYITA